MTEHDLGPDDGPDDGPDHRPDDGYDDQHDGRVDYRDPVDDTSDGLLPVGSGGRRRGKRRRFGGCLPVLVAVLVVAVVGYFAVGKGIDAVKDAFADPADFSGPGSGRVVFDVEAGASVSDVARNLKKDGVVASAAAFNDAVSERRASIQGGTFVLKKEMKASDVVTILGDPANDQRSSLTFLAGKTVDEIVALLVKNTDFSAKKYQKALADTDALGLPSYAEGNPEGYLFPDKYTFGPDDTPATILRAMVDRFKEEARDLDLQGGAKKLGYNPQQVLTIASMLQAEGRPDIQSKISRVIYNRLEIDPNPTAGLLQIDATVNFALGEDPNDKTVRLTQAQIDSVADSPYNTYTQKGLPPGPIEAPGGSAIEAALNPADGPWFFYVTVNLKTGETKFTDSNEERLRFRAELDDYCATKSDRC